MGQLPCTKNDSVPTAELEADDIAVPSVRSSSKVVKQLPNSEINTKHEFGFYDEKQRLEDIISPRDESALNSSQKGRPLKGCESEANLSVEECKGDSMLDSSCEMKEAVPKKQTYNSSYRLVKNEIVHRRLNPQAAPTRLRRSQPRDLQNSERLNLNSRRTGTSIPRFRENVSSSNQGLPHQGNRFGLSSTRSDPREGLQTEMIRPNLFGQLNGSPDFDLLVRLMNNGPLFMNQERGFGGAQNFSFARGFDNDGFFFFSVNLSPQGRQRPAEATKQQIEKAVSQLKGLTSDLEIKKGDTCPICLDQLRTMDDIVEMPCPCKRTFFHRKCAVDTLVKTKKIKCPNCRSWDGMSKDG